MVPYYEIDLNAPLSAAFGVHGVQWAQIVISVGSLAALASTMLVLLLAQSRMVFALSRDGLLPVFLSQMWHGKPFMSLVASGLFCFILGFFLNIDRLAELTSAGALFAFTMVSLCVLFLRIEDSNQEKKQVSIYVAILIVFTAALGLAVQFSAHIAVSIVLLLPVLAVFGLTCRHYFYYIHPATPSHIGTEVMPFRVPFVPVVPLLAIFINIYLFASLGSFTYIGFFSWLAIGLLVYFCYGFHYAIGDEDIDAYERLKAEDEEEKLKRWDWS
eukprot:TRINITY_DN4906_c0_g1_i2.p1 TRINITY_DN4906_c0_g1~~TRINITY_DN4906_c0_g1_i2.p1  ORF type:complete len:272 (-),score=40.48 TRINITY_DN4906_c0_g1_i2:93-908(-)